MVCMFSSDLKVEYTSKMKDSYVWSRQDIKGAVYTYSIGSQEAQNFLRGNSKCGYCFLEYKECHSCLFGWLFFGKTQKVYGFVSYSCNKGSCKSSFPSALQLGTTCTIFFSSMRSLQMKTSVCSHQHASNIQWKRSWIVYREGTFQYGARLWVLFSVWKYWSCSEHTIEKIENTKFACFECVC